MKRSRLKPVSAKRRKRDAVYQRQRAAAFDRAGGLCEAPDHVVSCSGRAEQCHHREGRNVPDPHHLDNLVCLSMACHSAAHMSPLWAYELGLSVRKNRVDYSPEAVPPGWPGGLGRDEDGAA